MELAAGSRQKESPSCGSLEGILIAHELRGVIHTGQHLFTAQRRKSFEDIVHRISRSYHFQNGLNGDARSANHGTPVAHIWINLNPF
jgi:hypothetical protein